MTECYHTFNVDVDQILNLDYINRKAAEGQGKGMVLVMSELALKQSFFNYLLLLCTSYSLKQVLKYI